MLRAICGSGDICSGRTSDVIDSEVWWYSIPKREYNELVKKRDQIYG